MIDILGGSVYDLLPPNLKTPEKRALAAAIKKMFDGVTRRLPSLLIYAEPGALDNQMCDLLAMTFNISAYDQTFDLDTKRKLVESTLQASSTKGTATAIREIITTIHGGARLEEWFDYGGEPFHFKVEIDAFKRGIDEDGYEKLLEIISAYNSAGTVLEAIIINLRAQGYSYIGGVTISGDATNVMPEVITNRSCQGRVFMGACILSGESVVVLPEITQSVICRCPMTVAAVIMCGDHTVIRPI